MLSCPRERQCHFPEPQNEKFKDGEAVDYYRGNVIPTTSNLDVVLKTKFKLGELSCIMIHRDRPGCYQVATELGKRRSE